MSTLEDLAQRVAALEEAVAQLRQLLAPRTDAPGDIPEPDLIRAARAQQAAVSAATAEVFAEMGITGDPVGVEKLREMMLACGVNPEENAFSREILAMREE